ncbi:CRAL/TRIO domain protein [Aspergillus pseudoustus]|uniref:CRAL/TRIO domain protein n=1 Tax=Aspergillus pseudoustus TaxID=1810923 RepID=A0ABR4KFS0_9EURO
MVAVTTNTRDEAAATARFSKLCAEKGLLKRQGWKDGDIHDGFTDQHTLLRFLQANNMDPSQALEQLQQAIDFHTKNGALALYDLIDVEDYEDTRRLYPTWTGRRDTHGRPLLMIDSGALSKEQITHWRATREIPSARQDGINSRYTSNMAQRALVWFDGLTRFVLPFCAAVLHLLKAVYIVDVASISLKQAWDVRDFAKELSWLLATCYPETIDRILVCNAPSYFATIWKILKGFIDPKTAEKLVMVTSGETYSMLSETIDHESIPRNFGGGFAYETGMLPDLDDELRQAMTWTSPRGQLPDGPIKWTKDATGAIKAIATGTVEGVERADEVGVLQLNHGNGVQ